MAISHDKKLIFIHIPKCAGTSIISFLNMEMQGHFTAHKYVCEQPPHPLFSTSNYLKFTIVRNPWDRVVSSYEYAKMLNSYYHSENNLHPDFNLIHNLTFEETLLKLKSNPELFKHPSWFPQYHWVCDYENVVLVDKIFKLENLDDEFNSFLKKYGYTETLPKLNGSNRNQYTSYYNEQTISLVSDIYQNDIKIFNYKYI